MEPLTLEELDRRLERDPEYVNALLKLYGESQDENERLRGENERLRAVLTQIKRLVDNHQRCDSEDIERIVDAALIR